MPSVAPAEVSPSGPSRSRSLAWRIVAGLAILLVLLALLLVFFPWDWLRGPINRYVTDRTGRHFAITRHLDVRLGRVTTVVVEGIEFANPKWAREPWLLRAQGGQFEVALWPLLRGEVVLPSVSLRRPELGLQVQTDGRRSWSLDRQQQSGRREPQIGELQVDQGLVRYFAPGQRIDITTELALAPQSQADLPLSFRGRGQWRGQVFAAEGRTGGVLRFAQDRNGPFPVDFVARAGATQLKAQGRITHLAQLAGMDLRVDLQGRDLEDLFGIFEVALPSSPEYRLQGQLHKAGQVWRIEQLQGRLGRSDVVGRVTWDSRHARPLLAGDLSSRSLDLADLGPMIGLPAPQRVPAAAMGRRPPREGRVLPAKPLNFSRLHALDVDLTYAAARIRNAPRWPLQSVRTHVKLTDGQLWLQPLELGMAGGKLAGTLGLDSRAQPAAAKLQLQAQGLQLARLLPAVETNRSSLGTLSGSVNLQGQGQSVARLLGSSSGQLSLLMGQGRISNILLEFMGLDGGEIIKFLVRGDENIRLRCGAVAFDVTQGRMDSRVILLDTVDTIVRGQGRIDLAQETLDLYFEPEPKDASIFSLRSPLRITGTLGAPDVGPDKGALASRAGLAVALAAINPLLALAATIETGPGEDARCDAVLRQAAAPRGSRDAGAPSVKR